MKIGRVSSPSVRTYLRSTRLLLLFVFCVVISYAQECPNYDGRNQHESVWKYRKELGCLYRRITNITLYDNNGIKTAYFTLPGPAAVYVNASWTFEWFIKPLFASVDAAGYYTSSTTSVAKSDKNTVHIFSYYDPYSGRLKKTVGLKDGFKADPSGNLYIFQNASVAGNITVNDTICVLRLCLWTTKDSTISIDDVGIKNNLSSILSLPTYDEIRGVLYMRPQYNYSIPIKRIVQRSNDAGLVAAILFFIAAIFVAVLLLGYSYKPTLFRRISTLIHGQQLRQSDRQPL
ncbi:m03 [Muromegalovirus G4]|uniref:M03 n=2 Tax=Murid herpesvirus 1 TaxID=10366 RepID=B3UWV6_MUHV1|nr:m03 protein [Murid betaherpesvirus 1]ACE95187.1 m03 [Muromegalovirus G4]QNL29142.1 m03 [Muromegalovirus G4]